MLGYKAYRNSYYRVVDHTLQIVSIYAWQGHRDARFDIIPMCTPYLCREGEGSLWGDMFEPVVYHNGLRFSVAEPEDILYWIEKVSHRITDVVLPSLEMAMTTADAYCLKRFWKENCPIGLRRTENTLLYEDYRWWLQLGQYQRVRELLYKDLELWKQTHDLANEYERISYENLMGPIKLWCEKSDAEIKQMIEENERRNLRELKWK